MLKITSIYAQNVIKVKLILMGINKIFGGYFIWI